MNGTLPSGVDDFAVGEWKLLGLMMSPFLELERELASNAPDLALTITKTMSGNRKFVTRMLYPSLGRAALGAICLTTKSTAGGSPVHKIIP